MTSPLRGVNDKRLQSWRGSAVIEAAQRQGR
jgi:hypothetical protein